MDIITNLFNLDKINDKSKIIEEFRRRRRRRGRGLSKLRKRISKKKNESSDFNILAILGIIFGLIITTFGGIFAWYRYGHKGDLPSWIPTFLTKLLRPSGVVVPTATATAMPTAIYQQ
tara:strand:- start:159 stop:512 length:354 start_codon:yes stop_codon:yes gene_type:complete